MPTIKDIAKYTGVSPTTVSNVIHGRDSKVSPETKEKVKRALSDLDYTANMGARLLAKNGSRIIGFIILDNDAVAEDFFDNPYHGELIQAVESKIKQAGYFMMFHRVSNFDEGAKLTEMWHLEGLIVSGTLAKDIPKWQEKVSVPIVFIDSYATNLDGPFLNVGIDDKQGAYEMTRYLLKNGHKKIGFLARGKTEKEWQGVDYERAKGVIEAMSKDNLSPELIPIPLTYTKNQPLVIHDLIEKIKTCSVFFCASDLLAVQLISELYKVNILVPRDISVVSFDGTPYAKYATPQITCIKQDVAKKADAIMNLILKGIESQNTYSQSVCVKTVLIEGNSVKKLT